MTNKNPLLDASRTLRLDLEALSVTKHARSLINKQSQAVRVLGFNNTDQAVSLTDSYTLPNGYKNLLLITSTTLFTVEFTNLDGQAIEQTCNGVYLHVGKWDGQVKVSGNQEGLTPVTLTYS